jgi:DNA-binding response OmpR family regulator
MRILIVDDDLEMCDMIRRLLEGDGYEVQSVTTGPQAIDVVVRDALDLILLDVMLDGFDGRDLLRELRLVSEVPVVFLTGKGSEIDRIAGLKMGADDYIVKPFSPGELAARVASILRRAKRSEAPNTEIASMDFGALRIDAVSHETYLNSVIVPLTAKEFDLLAFLASSPRQVFSRQQLLEQVWESSSDWQDEATVTEHVRRLRRKIEIDPDNPQRIVTVRGVGYRFEPN